MRIFIKLASYLKWVGLFSFFRFIFDSQLWKILWGFWIFGFFELLFTLPIFIQSLEQLFAMFAIPLKNNPVPSVSNYKSDIKYSLPFKGKWTVVNGGVDKELSHSWSINAQRYAYDFIKLDDKLKSYNGDRKKLENYYCYESDIIAPADGIIVEVSNKCKDSKIMWNNSTDPLIKDIRGNYIVIKHSEYEYSLICHIKPNSFLVKKGDLVKRYQKLAECGNSGNTTEPHIHFHVQNRRGFVSSAGLPIEFKDIKVDKVEDYNRYDSRPIKSDFDYSMYKGKYIHRGQIVSNILE